MGWVMGLEKKDACGGTEEGPAPHKARRGVPSRFCLCLALAAGLFVAWWEAFHEIACGGISIRTEVPLLYTYASCYAHAVGCIIGACAALLAVRRTGRRPAPAAAKGDAAGGTAKGAAGSFSTGRRAFLGLYAALVLLTVLFFLCLAYNGYALATAVQVLFNACAMALIVAGVAVLSRLALTDATFVLFACLVVFAVVDNLALPALIYAAGALVVVLPALAALAAAVPLLLRAARGMPEWETLMARVAQGAAQGPTQGAVAWHGRVPWQPLFHVGAYGLVFGLMHVEASSLITGFFDRNVSFAAGAVLAAALFYLCFVRASAGTFVWPKMRMVVFPLSVASFLMLPLLGTLQSFSPVALINGANLFYDAALVLAVLYVARETPVGAVPATVMAVVVKMASFLLGAVACHLEINLLDHDVLRMPLAGLAAFVLLAAATLWVGDDNRARKVWGLRVDREPRHARQVELQAKCNYLARRYRLTPKEREVAFLLASGKRVNQIADEMLVSVSTTRTHVRNLYAALDVHSYEQLAALIDAIDPAEAFSTGA